MILESKFLSVYSMKVSLPIALALLLFQTLYGQSFTLTSPNGGEDWDEGETHTVTWDVTGYTGDVMLQYSIDGGTNWLTIVDTVSAESGSYDWLIQPFDSSTIQALFRVAEAGVGTPLHDVNDAPFTLSLSRPDIYEPNDSFETAYPLTGNDSLTEAFIPQRNANVDEDYYKLTATAGQRFTISTNYERWETNTRCLIILLDTNKATQLIRESDLSCVHSFNFTAPYSGTFYLHIDPEFTSQMGRYHLVVRDQGLGPSLTLTSPNGGETWYHGETREVTWNRTGSIDSVKLEFDYGNGWQNIVTAWPNSGTFPWIVPEIISTTVIIRVSALDTNIVDQSDSIFAIYQPSITVLSPNGEENLIAGNNFQVQWTSAGIDDSLITLEYNSGQGWQEIASNIPNNGSHNWIVPDIASSSVSVRIYSGSQAFSDESDSDFTVGNITGLSRINQNLFTLSINNIEYKFDLSVDKINLYDMQGLKLRTILPHRSRSIVPVSGESLFLKPGVYLIQTFTANRTIVKKIAVTL